MKDLNGEVAVITGASGGIGAAVAQRMAGSGMKVVIGDIDADALAATGQALRDGGAEVHEVVVDVTDPAAVDGLRDAALDRFGSIYLVVNNAGIGACGRTWELSEEAWRRVVEVNLMGVVHGMRSFVPVLVEQGRGHLVNTASMAGLVARPLWSPYVATKFAVVGLTEAAYHEIKEVAPEVGVSLLCPGPVATDFLHPGRLASEHGGGDESVAAHVTMAHEKTNELGISPAEVAGHLHAAVVADRFYVLTHPGMKGEISRRAADIATDAAPSLQR